MDYFKLLEFDDERCGNYNKFMNHNVQTCISFVNKSIMVDNITTQLVWANLYETRDCTGDAYNFNALLTECLYLYDKYVKFGAVNDIMEKWIIVMLVCLFLVVIAFSLRYFFTACGKNKIPVRFMHHLR